MVPTTTTASHTSLNIVSLKTGILLCSCILQVWASAQQDHFILLCLYLMSQSLSSSFLKESKGREVSCGSHSSQSFLSMLGQLASRHGSLAERRGGRECSQHGTADEAQRVKEAAMQRDITSPAHSRSGLPLPTSHTSLPQISYEAPIIQSPSIKAPSVTV